MIIERYDPRLDKDELKEIFEDFIENKSHFYSHWEKFEKELNKRSLDLQYRNSMIVAKENGRIVGWGTYTSFIDYLGNERALIHQILTRKEDSYKKSIEENIIRELQIYIKKTLKHNNVFFICPDSDGSLRSVLLKIGAKKSEDIWYENKI